MTPTADMRPNRAARAYDRRAKIISDPDSHRLFPIVNALRRTGHDRYLAFSNRSLTFSFRRAVPSGDVHRNMTEVTQGKGEHSTLRTAVASAQLWQSQSVLSQPWRTPRIP